MRCVLADIHIDGRLQDLSVKISFDSLNMCPCVDIFVQLNAPCASVRGLFNVNLLFKKRRRNNTINMHTKINVPSVHVHCMCHLLFTLLCFLSEGPKTPHSTIQLQLNTSHHIFFTHPTHCSPSVFPSMPLLVLFSDFSFSFTVACRLCISLLGSPHPPLLKSLSFSYSFTSFYSESCLSCTAFLSHLDFIHINIGALGCNTRPCQPTVSMCIYVIF